MGGGLDSETTSKMGQLHRKEDVLLAILRCSERPKT